MFSLSGLSHQVSPTAFSPPGESPPICSEETDAALKSHFGIKHLRRYQKEAMDSIFAGRDCLVVMATGAGKSICYQLSAVVSKKTAVVVSPLLSLMQDQVMSLTRKGISADYLGCTQTNRSVISNAENGAYDVLFLTPEKAMSLSDRFWKKINNHGVCLFAVDEAHCISEWGPDFRQDYQSLHELRPKLPGVPFVALTATATERVRLDIVQSLRLHDAFISIGSFDRPNIYYSVTLMKGPGRVTSFLSLIREEVQRRFIACESMIIYCLTIRDTQAVYEALTASGISCGMYHGQMDRFSRENSHKLFVSNKIFVMVATIAFGMGIDKPDVRCVIHYGCPKSLESYYQESGRSGRDCSPSSCYLYYSRTDFCKGEYYTSDVKSETQKEAIMKAFIAAQKYCMIASCRRRELLKYFGEDSPANCGNCDNCQNKQAVQKDLVLESVLLLTAIKQCGCRYGLNMPISVLRGSKGKKITEKNFEELSVHGKGKEHSSQWWKCLASILSSNGFIIDTPSGRFRIVSLTEKGENLIVPSAYPHRPLLFTLPQEMIDEESEATPVDSCSEDFEESPTQSQFNNNEEFELYQMLVEVRVKLAGDISIPPLDICCDEVLRNLARNRPSSKGNLTLVDGVTQVFIASYSVIFLHHIRETCEELSLPFDNFDLNFSDDEVELGCGISMDNGITYEEILNKIRSLFSGSTGVSIEEILDCFPASAKDSVLRAVDELETSFQILSKNGLFFWL